MSVRTAYWREALSNALEARGIFDRLSPDDLNDVAEALAVSAENEALSRAPAGNPLAAEVRVLTENIGKMREAGERAVQFWREQMAAHLGVEESRLYRNGNRVEVRP